MDFTKVKQALETNGFAVSTFETAAEAAQYLNGKIDGKSVAFGGSVTVEQLGMYDLLASHNELFSHWHVPEGMTPAEVQRKAMGTQVYLTSANGLAETGELINIDGTGNRVAGSLFGHEKVYFVVSTNKIEPSLEEAVFRARNVAAPKNSLKYDLPTPCVIHYKRTGELKCFDCRRPERICNGIITYLRKMNDIEDVEVVLINEEMGF